MNDHALEDRMHALIQSKVGCFLPAGKIEYMTARDSWHDVEDGYKEIVTNELISRVGVGMGRHKDGFIAKKDGAIGVWIEKEFVSVSSDVEDIVIDVYGSMDKASRSENLIAEAAFATIQLQGAHPEAQFHVTEGRDTWSTGGGRVCMSVFIPEGVQKKKAIVDAFYEAELPNLDVGVVKQVFGDAYEELSAYFIAKTPEDTLKPKGV